LKSPPGIRDLRESVIYLKLGLLGGGGGTACSPGPRSNRSLDVLGGEETYFSPRTGTEKLEVESGVSRKRLTGQVCGVRKSADLRHVGPSQPSHDTKGRGAVVRQEQEYSWKGKSPCRRRLEH